MPRLGFDLRPRPAIPLGRRAWRQAIAETRSRPTLVVVLLAIVGVTAWWALGSVKAATVFALCTAVVIGLLRLLLAGYIALTIYSIEAEVALRPASPWWRVASVGALRGLVFSSYFFWIFVLPPRRLRLAWCLAALLLIALGGAIGAVMRRRRARRRMPISPAAS